MILGAGYMLYNAAQWRIRYEDEDKYGDVIHYITLKRYGKVLMYSSYDTTEINYGMLVANGIIIGAIVWEENDTNICISVGKKEAYCAFEPAVTLLGIYDGDLCMYNIGICYLSRYVKINNDVYSTTFNIIGFDGELIRNDIL